MLKMISRERTFHFQLRGLQGLAHEEVLGSLQEEIQAVQITDTECFITFKHAGTKLEIQNNGLKIRDKEIVLFDSDLDVTNVTVKDLPVELGDDFLVSSLMSFGEVVSGSVVHGKIKGWLAGDFSISNKIVFSLL